MRVFFAITFNQEINDLLIKIQENMKTVASSGNYTRQENLHLTLKFIGEVNKNELNLLIDSMNEIVKYLESFEVRIGELGEFKRESQSLVWLGLNNSKKLMNLYNKLQEKLENKGFEKDDKKFKSHITLARKIRSLDMNYLKNEITYEKKVILVNKITLMQSKRINGVLIYKPLYEVTF